MGARLLFGFGETDITPAGPVSVAGYGYERRTTVVHDPLIARSMAVSSGKTCAVLCVADLIALTESAVSETRCLLEADGTLVPDLTASRPPAACARRCWDPRSTWS